MVQSPRLLLITAYLLLAGGHCIQAAEIKIASPRAYRNREGEGSFNPGEQSGPYRYQQIFPAQDFSELGNKPHWIVGFAPRPDKSVTSPRTAYLPDSEVRLSTTQSQPVGRSPVFDNNFGADVMQFYRGPLTLVSESAAPAAGPREFYRGVFSAGVTPFLYDPSQGNLLLDFIAWQGENPSVRADQIPSIQTVLASGPSSPSGDRGGAAIFQFTFIPAYAGDANADGDVDSEDLINFLANWTGADYPAADKTWLDGDSDADGDVDSADMAVFLNQWTGAAATPAVGSVAHIPEPSSAALALMSVMGFWPLMRKRSR